jgi:HAD superfamily hydrolase (TIGR01509 family)
MQTPRGVVIFDLDGTLTKPVLDFDAIRAEIGLPPGPILEALGHLPHEQQQRAHAILERHEQTAAENAVLQDDAQTTLAHIRSQGWPIAILTRNARRWAELVIADHDLPVDALHTRDDGAIKPSPEPVRTLCAQTDAQPKSSWMVGDHLFDVQSGRAAGCRTVLFAADPASQRFAASADFTITRLSELCDLINGD